VNQAHGSHADGCSPRRLVSFWFDLFLLSSLAFGVIAAEEDEEKNKAVRL
jgi:hypothetical protein